MPIIVRAESPHPFLPSLGDPAAIEAERARQQNIRPMEIAIINLMADKIATERQLATWLGNTMLQVNVTFATTDSYVRDIHAGHQSKNTPPDHIKKFYSAWSDIRDRKFDGLIVTGINALKPTIREEEIWPDVEKILDWSEINALSSLFLCWGAHAALDYFHNIACYRGDHKLLGLFDHQIITDKSGLLTGFPDIFHVPVSRWRSQKREEIENHPALEIVADSVESGPNILAESASYEKGRFFYPKRLYVLNHPEYDTDTLGKEYARDGGPLPKNYFPQNDPSHKPLNTWRHTAYFYTNWIKAIYEATPYDITQIPQSFSKEAA